MSGAFDVASIRILRVLRFAAGSRIRAAQLAAVNCAFYECVFGLGGLDAIADDGDRVRVVVRLCAPPRWLNESPQARAAAVADAAAFSVAAVQQHHVHDVLVATSPLAAGGVRQVAFRRVLNCVAPDTAAAFGDFLDDQAVYAVVAARVVADALQSPRPLRVAPPSASASSGSSSSSSSDARVDASALPVDHDARRVASTAFMLAGSRAASAQCGLFGAAFYAAAGLSEGGILDGALRHVFAFAAANPERGVRVTIEAVNLRNEVLSDLLAPRGRLSAATMRVRDVRDVSGAACIVGAQVVECLSLADAQAAVRQAHVALLVSSTNMSTRPSDSTTFINVTVCQTVGAARLRCPLLFCHLASSDYELEQRLRAVRGDGLHRERTTQFWNVLAAIGNKRFIPWRDTRLSRLLNDSFMFGRVQFIAHLHPAEGRVGLHTLQRAQLMQGVSRALRDPEAASSNPDAAPAVPATAAVAATAVDAACSPDAAVATATTPADASA
jgi:hypothetical protein